MAVSTESFEILRVLARHRVDFIVVGMTAAVLQGIWPYCLCSARRWR
jgi:hypothetical protein